MKITNKTNYSGRALRSLFSAVYRNLEKTEGPHRNWKGYRFDVCYSRRRGRISGCAWIGGSSAVIRLPRGSVKLETAANVVEHELLHSYGHRHDAIGGKWTWSEGNVASFAWVRERFGEWMRETPKRAKAKTSDVQEHRLALAKAGLARWEKRAKVAQTRLKTLRRKVRYYERAMAAKGEVAA